MSEDRIEEIGRELFRLSKREKPGLFDGARWSGEVLEWAMRDPEFKTQMFRFVDVFPVLTSPDEVTRHIQEYLLQPGLKAPRVIKMALLGAGVFSGLASKQITRNLEKMAERFIAGHDPGHALGALATLRKQRQAFTVDLLGEATVSEAEADEYARRYLDVLETLSRDAGSWAPDTLLEEDDRGAIPRVNVSVKVSAMDSQLDALDFDHSVERVLARLKPLCVRARQLGAFVNLDMESHDTRDLVMEVFARLVEDADLAGWEDVGVVVQAYLRDAERDVDNLIELARRSGRRFTVRLVKGAYWDYETVRAAREGWDSPVWLEKSSTDACFERCAERLLRNHTVLRTAIGSHNLRSVAHAIATAEALEIPRAGVEFQALFGMAEPIRAALVRRGHRVRVYAPVGALIPGMAYLVRRLLENTSNESWLRLGYVEGADETALLAAPDPTAEPASARLRAIPGARTRAEDPGDFCNEPLRDFSNPELRAAFAQAVAAFEPGVIVRPVIDGEDVQGRRALERVDPSDGETVVGTVYLATLADADRAIAAAQSAFRDWADRPMAERADVLFAVAAAMRAERDELAAMIVHEVGKPWRAADADVCEAIDFCEYYGRQALGLGQPVVTQAVAGESNTMQWQARGVTAVIAPWNFPLAILCGMTSAALVTGNPVVLKPAEQSSVIAQALCDLFWEAGVPEAVLALLPGEGEVVGAHLVQHPDVVQVAFTGSMDVGLQIRAAVGQTVPTQRLLKRSIVEMGGKNAIIVDSDADLDEAVAGVVHSAFGFSGQKCSACSRVIVAGEQYETFTTRLVEAVESLQLGSAHDPGTAVGPVIDAEAAERIETTIADAVQRGLKLRCGGEPWDGPGHVVRPTIFEDVPEADPLAQEEVFGPVLAILRAEDFDDALRIATGTRFALTGGLYSRSPERIEQARDEFRVGNLYVNRECTGAVVERQPFGGFGMSGGGTKAGGPHYLLHFVDSRVITENTTRRGFTPDAPVG